MDQNWAIRREEEGENWFTKSSILLRLINHDLSVLLLLFVEKSLFSSFVLQLALQA